MDFTGKIALVTGGGSGIGQACVREFVARKAAVAVLDRDATAGRKTAEELRQKGGAAEYFQVDVSQRSQVEQTIAGVVAKLGGIDIVVNNAGIQRYGTATSTSEQEWDEVMSVNLKSAFLVSKYAIPEMIKRGGGAIVITGSAQSVAAVRNSAAYVVSKHGLLGLTRSMALDYGRHNIRVNCVCPGAIDTPMLRWAAALDEHPERVLEACAGIHVLGRMGQPEDVARVIAFLASDLASFVTGGAVMVEGGALVPVGGMAFQESGTGGAKTGPT
jgi:NAD(P)-dependent dehydrogenase (short-subunit alcohol dehydrogenase family)